MAKGMSKHEHLEWIVGAAILLGALLSFIPLDAGATN